MTARRAAPAVPSVPCPANTLRRSRLIDVHSRKRSSGGATPRRRPAQAGAKVAEKLPLFQAGQVPKDEMAATLERATATLRKQVDLQREMLRLAGDVDDPQMKAMTAADDETTDDLEERLNRMERMMLALRAVRGEGGDPTTR